jgi:hypothetical protein
MKHNLKNILVIAGMFASLTSQWIIGASPESNPQADVDSLAQNLAVLNITDQQDQTQKPQNQKEILEIVDPEANTKPQTRTLWNYALRLCCSRYGKTAIGVSTAITLVTILALYFEDPALLTEKGHMCTAAVEDWCKTFFNRFPPGCYPMQEYWSSCLKFIELAQGKSPCEDLSAHITYIKKHSGSYPPCQHAITHCELVDQDYSANKTKEFCWEVEKQNVISP